MKEINNKIETIILRIVEDTKLTGMIVGNVVVEEGSNFDISGMIKGDLELKSYSKVVITGTVIGNITHLEKSSIVEIFGILQGVILGDLNNVIIHQGAIIDGIKS